MRKKIIFLDVDGTLTDYENHIPASAAEAIRKARANGHRVYLCTGRSRAEIYDELWAIGLDGMIGGNGCYAEKHGCVLFHQTLSAAQCRAVVDWLRDRERAFYLECSSGLYASPHFREKGDPVIRLYQQRKGKAGQSVDQVFPHMIWGACLYRDDVSKISFILEAPDDARQAALAFPALQAGTWGGKGELALFGDLGVPGVDKGKAIERMLAAIGGSIADTIAFGDAAVDVPMLRTCAIGVAMGSGGEQARMAADHVTDDVERDGLAKAFAHFGLI